VVKLKEVKRSTVKEIAKESIKARVLLPMAGIRKSIVNKRVGLINGSGNGAMIINSRNPINRTTEAILNRVATSTTFVLGNPIPPYLVS